MRTFVLAPLTDSSRLAIRRLQVRRSPALASQGSMADVTDGQLRVEGRFVAGFELGPVNLELLAAAERDAALQSLAAFYDAIARPFQLVSIPPERNPDEHLASMEARVEGRRIARGRRQAQTVTLATGAVVPLGLAA